MRSDFSFWLSIKTRYRDMDAMNHVNSAVYHTYLEMARHEYFDEIGLSAMRQPGVLGPGAVSQTCNYRIQIHHPAMLDVGVRCGRIGNTSFTIEYELFLEGTETIVADGTTAMAWIDYSAAKAIPFPNVLREAIHKLEGHEV